MGGTAVRQKGLPQLKHTETTHRQLPRLGRTLVITPCTKITATVRPGTTAVRDRTTAIPQCHRRPRRKAVLTGVRPRLMAPRLKMGTDAALLQVLQILCQRIARTLSPVVIDKITVATNTVPRPPQACLFSLVQLPLIVEVA